MIPILYNKQGTGVLATLTDCIECYVEEERNGVLEVVLVYPNNQVAANLINENIIVCDVNDTLKNQQFRIYDTVRLMSNEIEVSARHISFDLAYDVVGDINIINQSCEYALNSIFRNSHFSSHYKGYSDIINAQNYSISNCSCLEAIAGTKGSIIDTFGTGAEILRDNTNIYVYNKRGDDNGVSIEYAKNLTGLELEEDTTELTTRIIPYATYTDENEVEYKVEVPSGVDSPLISNYSHPYIQYVDYSEKFKDGEIPTTTKLTQLAEQEYTVNSKDRPNQNFKIEFIPLSKCVGYEGLEDKISLCDTVTIKDTRYNIDTKVKVIKTTYNVLRDRYESMELGEPRTSLGDIINTDSIKGEKGDKGDKGDKGEDGQVGDFPDSLPTTPQLSGTCIGFGSIQLDWTFESQVYYQYELYASTQANFTPNAFDLIHRGQTSSFLFQAEPNETWYFRVCAVNSYGKRTSFSSQVVIQTTKIDDLDNYFTSAAIGNAVIGTLTSDYMTAGIIKGHYIDARNLSVTDGNGKRTLDIDSFGNVNLDVASLSIRSENVSQVVDDIVNVKGNEILTQANNNINTTKQDILTTTNNNINTAKQDIIKTTNSNIELSAQGILQTVSSTYQTKDDMDNYSTLSVMNSAINQKADNILSTVSSTYTTQTSHNTLNNNVNTLTNNLNNLQVGGTNLLYGTRNAVSWSVNTSDFMIQDPYSTYNLQALSALGLTTDDYITISFDWEISNAKTYGILRVEAVNGNGDFVDSIGTAQTLSSSNKSGHFTCTTQLTSTLLTMTKIRIRIDNAVLTFTIKNAKLEVGNKETAWCPSPEDVQVQLDTTNSNLTTNYSTTAQMNSAINQKASDILSTVSTTYATNSSVTNLSNNLATNYSSTTQMNSAIDQKASSILSSVSTTYATQESLGNLQTTVSETYMSKSDLEQTVDSITAKFSQSGGYNLIKNSTGLGGTRGWSSNSSIGTTMTTNMSAPERQAMFLDNTKTSEVFACSYRFILEPSTTYTLTGWVLTNSECVSLDIYLLSSTIITDVTSPSPDYTDVQQLITVNTNNNWHEVNITVTTPPNVQTGYIRIDNNGSLANGMNCRVYWNCLQLAKGGMAQPWTPHPSEVYDGITKIDKDGITVSQSNYNGYTQMTPSGFYVHDGSKKVITCDSNGLEVQGKIIANSGEIGGYTSIDGYCIDTGSIMAKSISSGAITSDKIQSGAITADKISASVFNGQTITGATITGSTIQADYGLYGAADSSSTFGYKFRLYSDGRIYSSNTIQVYGTAYDGSYCQMSSDGRLTSTKYIQTPEHVTTNSSLLLACNFGAGYYSGNCLSLRLSGGNYYFDPYNATGVTRLGSTSNYWSTVYATEGVSTGSDRTLKENIQYLNYDDTVKKNDASVTLEECYNFINDDYILSTYNYKTDDTKETKLSAIAQDVICNLDGSDNKIGQMIVNCESAVYGDGEQHGKLAMNQVQLLNVTIGALQKACKRINELEKRIEQLEGGEND